MSSDQVKLGTLARVQVRPKLDTGALLALAKERAPDATVFDDTSPFFWQVRASSNRLDFYDTRMRAGKGKTLDNFARALREGVSYQDSHKTSQNGWGQSLTGRLVTTSSYDPAIDERITEVWGELFTLPGLDLGGQSTDSMINAIRAGVWRDVSVGFYASDVECSLCGKQSFRFWEQDGCTHLPGLEYTFEDRTATAFAWINDGELVELSQVYKGASPSAAVQKAEQMNSEGMLSDAERAFISRQHNVRISEPDRTYALGAISKPQAVQEQPLEAGDRAQIVEALEAAAKCDPIRWPFDAGDSLGDAVSRLASQAVRLQDDVRETSATIIRVTSERDQAVSRVRELGDRGWQQHRFDPERFRA